MKFLKKALLFYFLSAPLFALAEPRPHDPFSDQFVAKLAAAPMASASLIMVPKVDTRKYEVLPFISEPSKDRFPEPRAAHFTSRVEPSLGLSPDEVSKIASYLKESKPISIEERFSTCKFQPGIRFTFYESSGADDKKYLPFYTILLCLNCDVWAEMKDSSTEANRQSAIAYFDSRPFRADLLELKRRLEVVQEAMKDLERRRRANIEVTTKTSGNEDAPDDSSSVNSNPDGFVFPPGVSWSAGAQLQRITMTTVRETRTAPSVSWISGNGYAMVNGSSSAFFWNSTTPPVIEVEAPSAAVEANSSCAKAFQGSKQVGKKLEIVGTGKFVGTQVGGKTVGAFKLATLISCREVTAEPER